MGFFYAERPKVGLAKALGFLTAKTGLGSSSSLLMNASMSCFFFSGPLITLFKLMFDLKLLIFATALGFWCSVYQKLMFSLFCLSQYEHFDHFVKITNNQRSYKPRSLIRNLVFNLWRCMSNEMFRIYVLKDHIPADVI